MRRLGVAIGCLTILPFGPRGKIQEADLGGSLLWFPLVGLLIGAWLVGVNVLASRAFPPVVVGACVLLAWVVATGALHLDGVGDVADGLYGGHTPAERLQIMKDPHVGAVAVVAIVCLLVLKFALLSSLSPSLMNGALLLAPCLGRYAMVVLGTTLPYARQTGGTGAPFVQHARPSSLIGATALSLSGCWVVWRGRGLVLLGVTLLSSVLFRAVFRRALGGITGDALGAAGELTEVLVLCGLALVTTT